MKTIPPKNSIYPLSALRALALHVQGLGDEVSARPSPSPDAIYAAIEKIGWLQLDALQMVRRSQDLVLWSRLGSYDTTDLARLLSDRRERRVFEYWLHAACIIPLTEYRYLLPRMRRNLEATNGWDQEWLQMRGNGRLVRDVLARVKIDGPVRAADFQRDGPRRGSWWDWKPAKRALERLYNQGELMIADRINFQRVYDLKDRVLPDWVDATEPTHEEATTHLLERSIRSLGVCRIAQVGDYAHIKRGAARPVLERLAADGAIVTVKARLSDGETREMVVHRDNLSLLGRAADGDLAPVRTTFLSPFDNLFWGRGRDQELWSFRHMLEAYKPEKARIWGYFCLPILHEGRLVGRFDPKLDRKAGVLRLKAVYLEPGVDPDERLVAGVAGAMRDFMAFHDATELVVEQSDPKEFGVTLTTIL